MGITCSMLSRRARFQHAPPPSPPAIEHYLANSQPRVGFRSSTSTHNLLIIFLREVHTCTCRYLTVLKSESRCVIRNTFHSHLPLLFLHQRTQDAKCTHNRLQKSEREKQHSGKTKSQSPTKTPCNQPAIAILTHTQTQHRRNTQLA